MNERSPVELPDHLRDRIVAPPPAWSPCLPQIVLRQEVTDFVVQELPAYEPCGAGEHLYLWLQKTDVAAADLTSRLARQLEISPRDIGVAGQKDRRAVTRQYVSVPFRCAAQLASLQLPGVEILQATQHTNKLKTGHLSGNRFELMLRVSDATVLTRQHAERAAAALQDMSTIGFPNYYGPQRFGTGGRNVDDGIAWLRRPALAKRWSRGKHRYLSRLLPSAVQSAVFNLVVAARVTADTFRTVQEGDVVCRRDGTRPFPLADAAADLLPELIPMGPLPGPDMLPATGPVRERESACLDQLGLNDEDFARFKRHSRGTRRKMVETLQDPEVSLANERALRVAFTLPAGSFATVVLAQLCAAIHTVTGQDTMHGNSQQTS